MTARSIERMPTAASSRRYLVQPASQIAGQTRLVNSGKEFVAERHAQARSQSPSRTRRFQSTGRL